MYCRKCGTELAPDAKFCKKCGTAVRDGGPSPAAEPAGETNPAAEVKPAPAAEPAPAAKPAPAARPTPAARPIPTVKPAFAAKSAAKADTDKIDVKLIVAVMVFLIVQLAVVTKVVFSVDTGSGGTSSPLPAEPVADVSPGSYFGDALYVGGKVEFGSYEQDGNTQNGPEPIEWDVAAAYEDGYLLVSRYILDGIPWDDAHVR